jgi:lysophospholipase L1-like esterase
MNSTLATFTDRAPRRAVLFRGWISALTFALCAHTASSQVLNTTSQDLSFSSAGWVTTWTASPMAPGTALGSPTVFENQTVRQVAHISVGGKRVRIRLSNAFGLAPLHVSDVRIALHTDADGIIVGSSRVLTFSGQRSFNIPQGAVVVSDAIDWTVPALSDLAVSVYVDGNTGPATYHEDTDQTAYISTPGNFTSAPSLSGATPTRSKFWLSAIEILPTDTVPVVVTLGDSITEGFQSTVDANHRWPDLLSARVNTPYGRPRLGVANQGIGCSRLLYDFCGPNGESRTDRDVIAVTGATHVILALGINDLGFPTFTGITDQIVSADDIIAGLTQVVQRAHAKGLKVIGATLTPVERSVSSFPNYFTPENEVKRQAINRWIRTTRTLDGVVDFDAVLRDPAHPTFLRQEYSSVDGLHPNDAGYQAMANAIDLSLLR